MAAKTRKKRKLRQKPVEVSIVLAGEAGQGIQSIETILVHLLKRSGYHVFATKEYMSRVRGGVNSTQIRISDARVSAFSERTDLLIPLEKAALTRLADRIQKKTLILGEKDKLGDDRVEPVPFSAIAAEIGNPVFASMVAVGAVCGILGTPEQGIREYVEKQFSRKGAEVVEKNMEAYARGRTAGARIAAERGIDFGVKPVADAGAEILLSGSDAAALGAVAGGCDAVFAYPMTPATGVFTALAGMASDAGIAVEQVEDEIGVINMALGAWYAGARALVTTSGGGFCLMTEGVSLSGITETPVVVLVSQRPGPATGLPTRTEQGDLDLVLHAGHGVFPRIILAPGDTAEAFELSAAAFDLADRFQVPVFILTDQYLVDSYYNIPLASVRVPAIVRSTVPAGQGYRRYEITRNGISPRALPGTGPGRVCVDSDEHDEEGRITEDLRGVSLAMKEKRMRKAGPVAAAAVKPTFFGNRSCRTLFVGWGSVKNAVLEALRTPGLEDAGFLHFSQVYPVPRTTGELLRKVKRIVMIENNQTCQFGRLLAAETGRRFDSAILKYDGMPFSAEELGRKMLGQTGRKS